MVPVFSLLAGNLDQRKVRARLRPPPASLGISLCFPNCDGTREFLAQLPRFWERPRGLVLP
jgi:hypothetical protein